MPTRRILILSHSQDEHVPLVRAELDGSEFVFNADKHFELHFDPHRRQGFLTQSGDRISLADEVGAVWSRRAFSIVVPETPEQRFTRLEQGQLLHHAISSCVLRSRWINHPRAVVEASDKLENLHAALEEGLSVPAWCISNVPSELLAFAKRYPRMVLKPARVAPEALIGAPALLYAHPVSAEELRALLDDSVYFPMFLQARVAPKAADWRVSIVDDHISAIRMSGCPEEIMDFRLCYDKLRYEVSPLPAEIERSLLRLLRRLGLRYGAADFVEDRSGQLLFLEVNPSGQFGWLEKSVTPHAPAAFAKLLASALLGSL